MIARKQKGSDNGGDAYHRRFRVVQSLSTGAPGTSLTSPNRVSWAPVTKGFRFIKMFNLIAPDGSLERLG
jgi:hypothetical protein